MKGWQKTSFIDYPDKIASVFFFGGCNFRCAFCHNPELVLKPESLPDINDGEVLSYLETKKHLYEGVCVSGGEPTLYPDLEDILIKIKALDLLVKLDTNGTQPDKVKRWVEAKLIDYVAMDIKTSPTLYKQVFPLGLNHEGLWSRISETIEFLKDDNVPYEFRSTLYPPFFPREEWGAIKALVAGAPAYYLQPFNSKVTLAKETKRLSIKEEEIMEMRDYFAQAVGKCEIR